MYSSKLSTILILLLISINLSMPAPDDHLTFHHDVDDDFDHVPQNKAEGRFLLHQEAARMTRRRCDKYPRVCDSKVPDCCKKKCVNVMKDRNNCGRCGKRCKYSEVCCNGWCVNPSWDERHCGSCNHRCKKRSQCRFGMCSYA